MSLGVRDLVLNGYGEIATLRNYRDYLGYIRRRSSTIRILVNTNGMRLTEDLSAAFIDHGVDVVNIAIDGATAATYESIRRYLKLDVVEANVKRFIAMRNASGKTRPYIMVNMISTCAAAASRRVPRRGGFGRPLQQSETSRRLHAPAQRSQRTRRPPSHL